MSLIREDDSPLFVLGLLLGLLVIAALAMASDARVAVHVEGPRFRFEPADLVVKVTVSPRAENRYLLVEADSDGFYRRSDEQLEGMQSPRTRWIRQWRDFPAGAYRVSAEVRDGRGRVLGRAMEPVWIGGDFDPGH